MLNFNDILLCMNVLVTRNIPETGISILEKEGYSVHVLSNKFLSRGKFLRAIKKGNYDAILCLLSDKIDSEVFDLAPNVKIFANYAVGFNNIDIEEAKKRDVFVSNTPQILTNTVAEHTVSLILGIATRLTEADKYVKAGRFKGWSPDLLLGSDLMQKKIGILGAGRIGTRVAEICNRGFKMDVLYHDINRNKVLEEKLGAKFVSTPEDLLRDSDFVSVHIPLNDDTYHFINSKRLQLMKRTSFLINASRGAVIDEEALISALKFGVIRGAALDVFEHEPKIPRGLRKLDNVILTPHFASASIETRSEMSKLAANNIVAVLKGKGPITPVY